MSGWQLSLHQHSSTTAVRHSPLPTLADFFFYFTFTHTDFSAIKSNYRQSHYWSTCPSLFFFRCGIGKVTWSKRSPAVRAPVFGEPLPWSSTSSSNHCEVAACTWSWPVYTGPSCWMDAGESAGCWHRLHLRSAAQRVKWWRAATTVFHLIRSISDVRDPPAS